MFKRIDQTKLYPYFFKLLEELVANCQKRGAVYFCIDAFRDEKRQKDLYAQGRTTPGKIVTNAKEFQSLHNFGLAVDFCKDADMTKEGLQPSWKIEDYNILAEEARKLGLETGMDFKTFKEGPHVQFKTTKTLKELEALFKKGGLSEVWLAL